MKESESEGNKIVTEIIGGAVITLFIYTKTQV